MPRDSVVSAVGSWKWSSRTLRAALVGRRRRRLDVIGIPLLGDTETSRCSGQTSETCRRTLDQHGLASERSGGGADKGGGSCKAGAGTDYDSMIGSIPAMLTHRARPLLRSCTNVCAALMRGKEGRECLQGVCLIVLVRVCTSAHTPSSLQRMYVRDCALGATNFRRGEVRTDQRQTLRAGEV